MSHPLRARAAVLLAALCLSAASLLPAQAPPAEYRGAEALGLALRRVGTTKRVLMIGAHPDDEDTQLLAALALEQGADAAYLSLTRGEGGQNGIGPELGEALGLLRTEELLAARRVDGARQFFTRAYDFGFSKNAAEALRHWPRDSLLADVVRVVRAYRPDVVIPVFSGTPADGHGQHQVSALLAREAMDAAADPSRFPEQIRAGLAPYRPARLYRSLRSRADSATVRIPLGVRDPLLGRSPFQIAMASRSRHRSQDMGQAEPAGPRWGYLRRVLPAPAGPEASLWAGLDTTLAQRAAGTALQTALERYQEIVLRLRAEAPLLAPAAIVPALADAHALLTDAEANAAPELRARIVAERTDVEAALRLAAGVVVDAVADDARVVPGQEISLAISVWNGGVRPVRAVALAPRLPAGWSYTPADSTAAAAPAEVAPGALLTRRFRVRIPPGAARDEPYFLRQPRQGDLYTWPADAAAAAPFDAPRIGAAADLQIAGRVLRVGAEASVRTVDPRQGELRTPVLVVPAVSVLLEPRVRVLPLRGGAAPKLRVELSGEAPDGTVGTLRLLLPEGWRAEPAELPVRLAGPGARREVEFTLRPPATLAPGDYAVRAVFTAQDGRRYTRGVQIVDYPHVRARPLYRDAATTLRAFDVRVPAGLRVGYVAGAGEEGAPLLTQIGLAPTLLDAEALESSDLSRYDVIVTGSRAYEVRPDLRANNRRLLDYVRNGGTLIVQYNKYELPEGGFPPYPFTLARPHDRVTDEAAPVRIIAPDHPALTTPNRITAADFAGWVQDRGLYFAHTWDAAYTPLLEMADPGEPPLRGGLLVARYGRGTYVYTGLAFFRQLPEGVPGAWRLFANLLALGARR